MGPSILDLTGDNPCSRLPNSEFRTLNNMREWLKWYLIGQLASPTDSSKTMSQVCDQPEQINNENIQNFEADVTDISSPIIHDTEYSKNQRIDKVAQSFSWMIDLSPDNQIVTCKSFIELTKKSNQVEISRSDSDIMYKSP